MNGLVLLLALPVAELVAEEEEEAAAPRPPFLGGWPSLLLLLLSLLRCRAWAPRPPPPADVLASASLAPAAAVFLARPVGADDDAAGVSPFSESSFCSPMKNVSLLRAIFQFHLLISMKTI